MISEKQAAEELNAPNPFKRLQEEWVDNIAEKEAEKAELEEAVKKQRKLSPGTLKKLKEYKPL